MEGVDRRLKEERNKGGGREGEWEEGERGKKLGRVEGRCG